MRIRLNRMVMGGESVGLVEEKSRSSYDSALVGDFGNGQRVFLGSLGKGSLARIARIEPGDALGQRLLALGLLPGMLIHVVHIAPLGDPIAVDCAGRRVSLRRAEAGNIAVELMQ